MGHFLGSVPQTPFFLRLCGLVLGQPVFLTSGNGYNDKRKTPEITLTYDSKGLYKWWTQTKRIRTQALIPFEVTLFEEIVPPYQAVAEKAAI